MAILVGRSCCFDACADMCDRQRGQRTGAAGPAREVTIHWSLPVHWCSVSSRHLLLSPNRPSCEQCYAKYFYTASNLSPSHINILQINTSDKTPIKTWVNRSESFILVTLIDLSTAVIFLRNFVLQGKSDSYKTRGKTSDQGEKRRFSERFGAI